MSQLELLPIKSTMKLRTGKSITLARAKEEYRQLNRKWEKHKKEKPLSSLEPKDQATRLILDGELSRGEAIDFLVKRGWSENDALSWALQTFTGTYSNDSSATIIKARTLPVGRSARRKAA